MKLILRTLFFIVIALLMACIGSFANSYLVQRDVLAEALSQAEDAYKDYTKYYIANRKTIVVIGTSTSILSFKRPAPYPDPVSYVSILRSHFNVLNLSSVHLRHIAQANVLLEFAQRKVPEADLLILENLDYMKPVEIFEGSSKLYQLSICLKNSLNPSSNIYDKNFYDRECKLIYDRLPISPEIAYQNPCLKKHQLELPQVYLMTREDRSKFIEDLIVCGHHFDNSSDVRNRMIDNFHYGYLQELKQGFENAGENFESIDHFSTIQFYSTDRVILIEQYMKEILKKQTWKKVLIIPAYAADDKALKQMAVLDNYKDKVFYLSMRKEMDQLVQEKNSKFADIFFDGAHSTYAIHEIMAEKIMNMLKD